MPAEHSVSLGEIATSAHGRAGVVWALGASNELNANLVRFEAGGGVGEHVNDEVDVIILGIRGTGFVEVDGEMHPVSNGTMTFVPKGARRSTRGASGGFAYLTVHRRRGPLQIGGWAREEHESGSSDPQADPLDSSRAPTDHRKQKEP
jgi:quercetin dioxygenase-like cupin family protein